MSLNYFDLLLASLLPAFLLYRIYKLTKKLEEYERRNLRVIKFNKSFNHYTITIELMKFLYTDDNISKVIEFFRADTNMKQIFNYMLENNYSCVMNMNGIKNNSNVLTEYEYYESLYGTDLFNFYPDKTYIALKYSNEITYFTSFNQLNVFRWIINSGLYDYMSENRENLMREITDNDEEILDKLEEEFENNENNDIIMMETNDDIKYEKLD